MTKKLFYVEVTKSAWVLAESATEAETFADKILETEYLMDIDVFPYTEEYLKVSGWTGDEYIYHKDQRNTDVKLGHVLTEMRKGSIDSVMQSMHPEWRYRWCDAGACGCRGCANGSGGLASLGYTQQEHSDWVKRNPAPAEDATHIKWGI